VLQPDQLANLLNDRRSHALGLTREAPIDDAVEALFHRF
jgi:hypothetical protein